MDDGWKRIQVRGLLNAIQNLQKVLEQKFIINGRYEPISENSRF